MNIYSNGRFQTVLHGKVTPSDFRSRLWMSINLLDKSTCKTKRLTLEHCPYKCYIITYTKSVACFFNFRVLQVLLKLA